MKKKERKKIKRKIYDNDAYARATHNLFYVYYRLYVSNFNISMKIDGDISTMRWKRRIYVLSTLVHVGNSCEFHWKKSVFHYWHYSDRNRSVESLKEVYKKKNNEVQVWYYNYRIGSTIYKNLIVRLF